jgi:hypothetical protein
MSEDIVSFLMWVVDSIPVRPSQLFSIDVAQHTADGRRIDSRNIAET